MDVVNVNIDERHKKQAGCLVVGKDVIEAQTLIVKDDGSVRTIDDPSSLVTYRFLQVAPNGETISTVPSSIGPQSSVQTLISSSVNGQVYVIGSEDTYKNKPIAPRSNRHHVHGIVRNAKEDKRRATHNEVERRRRDKINSWIITLSKQLPEGSVTNMPKNTYDGQYSKGGILSKACDYIDELKQTNRKLVELLKENQQMCTEFATQAEQIDALQRENMQLRNMLIQHGIDISHLKSEFISIDPDDDDDDTHETLLFSTK